MDLETKFVRYIKMRLVVDTLELLLEKYNPLTKVKDYLHRFKTRNKCNSCVPDKILDKQQTYITKSMLKVYGARTPTSDKLILLKNSIYEWCPHMYNFNEVKLCDNPKAINNLEKKLRELVDGWYGD